MRCSNSGCTDHKSDTLSSRLWSEHVTVDKTPFNRTKCNLPTDDCCPLPFPPKIRTLDQQWWLVENTWNRHQPCQRLIFLYIYIIVLYPILEYQLLLNSVHQHSQTTKSTKSSSGRLTSSINLQELYFTSTEKWPLPDHFTASTEFKYAIRAL